MFMYKKFVWNVYVWNIHGCLRMHQDPQQVPRAPLGDHLVWELVRPFSFQCARVFIWIWTGNDSKHCFYSPTLLQKPLIQKHYLKNELTMIKAFIKGWKKVHGDSDTKPGYMVYLVEVNNNGLLQTVPRRYSEFERNPRQRISFPLQGWSKRKRNSELQRPLSKPDWRILVWPFIEIEIDWFKSEPRFRESQKIQSSHLDSPSNTRRRLLGGDDERKQTERQKQSKCRIYSVFFVFSCLDLVLPFVFSFTEFSVI